MKKILLLPLFLGCVFSFFAQDSLLVSALQQHTYSLHLEENRFQGEGASILRAAIPGKQFLLVGEQHGIREVGQFTKVLFLEAQSEGVQHLVFETDPFIAQKLEEAAKDSLEAFKTFCGAHPFTVPFYNNVDDFGMLETIAGQSEAEGPVFWGVDQVFAGAPGYLFSEMARTAPSEEAQELAQKYIELDRKGLDVFLKTGDPSQTLTSLLQAEDYEKLFALFGDDPNLKSTQMLKGIQKTQEIYGYWFQGKQYLNNKARTQLMKKQFMDYYVQAATDGVLPKAVFKFGATHTYRGLSYYDQFDLGNLAAELAEMNGLESLHIYFTGIKGEAQGAFGPPQAFDNTDDLHPLVWAAVKDRLEEGKWLLIDFRPLRESFSSKQLKPLREIIHSNDIWILVSEAMPIRDF